MKIIANFFRRLFGSSESEQFLLDLVTDLQTTLDNKWTETVSLQIKINELKTRLYRPNEKIGEIRQPLLDAIMACQGSPQTRVEVSLDGNIIGEPEFIGFAPPDITSIKQKIEKALSACDVATQEQMKGIDGP